VADCPPAGGRWRCPVRALHHAGVAAQPTLPRREAAARLRAILRGGKPSALFISGARWPAANRPLRLFG